MLSWNPSTWKGEAGGYETQGQPWLHRQFEASLGYSKTVFPEEMNRVSLEEASIQK